MDDKYNGTSNQIRDLHSDAWNLTGMSSTNTTNANYAVVSGNKCNGNGGNVPSATDRLATKVFVNCPTFNVSSGYFFPNATHFITTGEVDIANNGVLALPNVERLYVSADAEGAA